MRLTLFVISTLLSFPASSNDFSLSEKTLGELAKNVPSYKQIEMIKDSSELAHLKMKDTFTTKATLSGFYSENKEKQLNNFVPVTSPIKDFSIGFEKDSKFGMSVNGKVFATQTTNNFVTSSTTTGVSAAIAMDLHRNFLGKTTKTELSNKKLEFEKSKLEEKISKKVFIQNLRKLYWALIANNEAQLITNELLSTAKKQVKQAEARFKNKVADSGEVARYRSQVAARSASLISLQYQQSSLTQSLKELIPELGNKNIILAKYNLDETVQNVLSCSTMLESKKESPLDYTYYDDIINILKSQNHNESKVDKLYDTWDLSLQSEFKKTGKEFAYSDSFSDLRSDSRNAYQVGLKLTIPLGASKKKTKTVKQIVTKKKYQAQQESHMAKIEAFHTQMIRSVSLLKEVVKNQKINSFNLSKSLKVSQRKYRQARISVEQLVQEQDVFLNSNLAEIDTKLSIIYSLLDYFTIYTETPCNLNRI
ncbi:MAG: TolC family protein [Bacteriovoracaceae bacterium]|nr:TolC family protein [Bacteriovoracaceae bacterium]